MNPLHFCGMVFAFMEAFAAKPCPSAVRGPPETLLGAQNSWEGEKFPPRRMKEKLQVW